MNSTPTSRNELGNFLRNRRKNIDPGPAKSPKNRRRTKGLRREEVAELAGIGVDWYIRLEQGRMVRPSKATVEALSKALQLSEAESAHLRMLARNLSQPAFRMEVVPETLSLLVHSLPHPAYITGRRWDVLAWNRAASEVIVNFANVADTERNLLLLMCENPEVRLRFGDQWKDELRRMVALFRSTFDLWASDIAFTDLVERLRRSSEQFANFWAEHRVDRPTGTDKVFHHAEGDLRFHAATFQANENPELRLTLYTPINSDISAMNFSKLS